MRLFSGLHKRQRGDRWLCLSVRRLSELHADLFSRRAYPLEQAVVLLRRSTKQLGLWIVPRTRCQVYCKKQAGRVCQSERKRIDRRTYLFFILVCLFVCFLLYCEHHRGRLMGRKGVWCIARYWGVWCVVNRCDAQKENNQVSQMWQYMHIDIG